MNAQTTPEITMIEQADKAETNEAPIPIKDFALLGTMLKALTDHIERVVDRRFAALVESHQTMKLMDENMQLFVANLIDDRIHEHEQDHEHKTDEDIETEVSNHVEYFLRQGDHQFITERDLSEKVSDVLDEVLEDRVRDLLDGASISVSL